MRYAYHKGNSPLKVRCLAQLFAVSNGGDNRESCWLRRIRNDLSGPIATVGLPRACPRKTSRTMATLRTVAMLMVFMTIMGIVGGVYSLQDQIAQSVNAH